MTSLKESFFNAEFQPKTRHDKTLRMVQMAMLAAVSIVLVLLIRIPLIPAAPFLVYDMADVPVLLGAFILGPGAGLTILFVVSFIQAFFLGGNGIIGLFMHLVASGTLVVVAGACYRALRKKNSGMIIGLICGSLSMALIMIPLNFIFTPKIMMDVPIMQAAAIFVDAIFGGYDPTAYTEVAVNAFTNIKLLLFIGLIPFNLIKAMLNSFIFFVLYKSLHMVLTRHRRLQPSVSGTMKRE